MFYIAQAGSSLQVIQTDGTIQTLALPAGVTINAAIRGRFVVFAQQIFFVNAGTVNLWIDPFDFTVRPMNIKPPIGAPSLAAGASTGLTGVYRTAVAFYVKNQAGDVVNLSPLGPLSLASVSLANQDLAITNIPLSPDASKFVSATSTYVFGRRVYRTAAGGTDLFELLDLDDNATASINTSLSDTALGTLPASLDLGLPPGSIPDTGLSLIVEWKGRLWAVSSKVDEVDQLLFTEVDQFYGWSPDSEINAVPIGADRFGVTGFLRRRDYLGVAKRDRLLKVIGSSPDDLELVIVAEGAGCVAPESCVVIRDKGYYLGLDGVYQWDDSGAVCISRATVDPWFTTDATFNRARFVNAFAGWNPVANTYDLHLAALGSNVEDVWISYHLDSGEFLGPHKTAAFTPSCRALLEAASDAYLPVIGGADDYVYVMNQAAASDISGAAVTSAIEAFFEPRWHFNKAPDITHYWGRLSIISRFQVAGSQLTITPYVGRLDAAAQTDITHDMTLGREMLRRLGVGPLCRLKFYQKQSGKGFVVYGYEIKPTFEVGLR